MSDDRAKGVGGAGRPSPLGERVVQSEVVPLSSTSSSPSPHPVEQQGCVVMDKAEMPCRLCGG
ncbi:hypothetical protein EYF80_013038 [Liparis tanakae]|uniref:Uncharacterized protein n=1 Tax=Liparis tanakae TaxID=230148 RepID=A0A4Z2IFG8_9TELE|nr:hypothetical protein EYF80_013038 [Liparis tanakae]